MWVWFLVSLAGLIVLVLFCMWIPLHAVLEFDTGSQPKIRFYIRWFFGLIRRNIQGSHVKLKAPGSIRKNRVWKIIWIEGLFSSLWILGKTVVRRIHIKSLDVRLRFGTGDPAETGIIAGLISAIKPSFRLPSSCTLDLQPSYGPDWDVSGTAYVDFMVRPLHLIWPLTRFLLSRPARKAARILLSRTDVR